VRSTEGRLRSPFFWVPWLMQRKRRASAVQVVLTVLDGVLGPMVRESYRSENRSSIRDSPGGDLGSLSSGLGKKALMRRLLLRSRSAHRPVTLPSEESKRRLSPTASQPSKAFTNHTWGRAAAECPKSRNFLQPIAWLSVVSWDRHNGGSLRL
jgi:hypothetical protein